jgi:beta-N-acetylhexosaminidase
MKSIELKENPFYLSTADITWVEQTLAGMDLQAKVGQLFCLIALSPEPQELDKVFEVIEPGGFMFRPMPGAIVQAAHRYMQEKSPIPLLLAANLERGGNGIASDGTDFGAQLLVAASDDDGMAYKLGLICGREGRAVGCNWSFAPVIDIDFNPQNPITNTRTFGSDPDRVLRMAQAYMAGVQENGLAVSIKHWPGDGVDGRDQHLVVSVNSLSTERWDETFGKVYEGMITAGAKTVMAAHIMLPHYSRKLHPGIRDEEIMPATLAPEITIRLLREQLGFNGLVVTDATPMSGFLIPMPRRKAVPATIAAGCDMFLFTINLQEDVDYMLAGVQDGSLSMERLDEAVTRILALKASLGLHRQKQEGTLVPDESALQVLNCEEHRAWAAECADKAITLVKDTQNLLPLSPEKHKRVLLYVLGDVGGYMDDRAMGVSGQFIQLMEANGFEIHQFDYAALAGANMWAAGLMRKPIQELKAEYDLILYFASLKTASNQTVVRITWAQPMGLDVPKYVSEIPTAFISVDNPYHLQDVPRVKTFINGYTSNECVVEAIVDKLLGKSPFTGVNPVDPFCGLWDARL